ncbi:ribose 5-phosphate isomerase B [bacterium]|nr:ribose 5-phosphate isomerase B [bacterium]
MKIALAADHAGFTLKETLKKALLEKGYEVCDFGTHSNESMDYPDVIHPAAKAVSDNKYERGVFVCGSGQGTAMTANRYPGVRAALCWNTEIAGLSRKHNDANVLCLPGRFLTSQQGIDIMKVWLETEFDGGRHTQRLEKIDRILDL